MSASGPSGPLALESHPKNHEMPSSIIGPVLKGYQHVIANII